MAPQVLLAGPAGFGHHDYGIVGANVGLVEDEGLLLAGRPPVLHPLHQVVVDGVLLHQLSLQGRNLFLHHVPLPLPVRLLFGQQLDLLVEILHHPAQRVGIVSIVLEALAFLHLINNNTVPFSPFHTTFPLYLP